jgi:putative ABC transport system permease protein
VSAREVFRSALRGLTANVLRSFLTVLGILIGVGAVIVLVAVGNGSAQSVKDQIQSLGSNTITISGSGGRGGLGTSRSTAQDLTLTVSDALTSKTLAPDIKTVSPVQTASAAVTYNSTSATVTVTGTTPSYFEASNFDIATGSMFTTADDDGHSRVAVIGSTTADNLFSRVSPLGRQINVNGVSFTVIGVLSEKDTTGFADPNDTVIAPITAVRDTIAGYGALSSIVVQATKSSTVTAAQSEATAILDQELGVTSTSTATYRILNQSQLLSASTSTASTFTVLLASVAAISLLVGGIGVTNIMLVTVTERTREIGIRKALGAQRSAILGQFLSEATVLSLVGGALGVGVGLIGSQFTIVGVKPVIVPSSIALAFGVSAVIGLFFGSFPAHRASRLQPIDALRYQ